MSHTDPGNTANMIEADAEIDDGYETATSQKTDTTSLKSSLNEYLEENGRRYHAYYGPDKNLMPTDEIEQERLDITHEIMLLIADGKLYEAPVEQAHRVLDIGTGTGIWAVEYASQHPESEVTGLDLRVPPNCRFEVDDFELEWTYKPDFFDFIHARNIIHSVKDNEQVFPQVMRHLKPGGWFEFAELGSELFSDDNTLPEDWPLKMVTDMVREGLQELGRVVPSAELMKQLMQDAGFVDIKVKTYKMPLTPWPKNPDLKQAGLLFAMSAESTALSYSLSLCTKVHGMSKAEVDDLAKRCGEECLARKTSVHAYSKYYVVYGRKPNA